MKRSLLRRAGILLAGLASLVITALAPVSASASVRGDVLLVGEKPVSGTYNLAYRNYSEQFCGEQSYPPYICYVVYHVSRGTAAVKLRTYKLKEGLKKYDYYIVDVEVDNVKPYGASSKGWMKVHIYPEGSTTIVDSSDTQSVSSSKSSCYSVTPSFGASIGPVGASFSAGSVRFCGKGASYQIDYRKGARTVWMAHNLRKISTFVSERIVKVHAGAHPRFGITVHVPTDKCTDTWHGDCSDYTNDTTLYHYKIGTSG